MDFDDKQIVEGCIANDRLYQKALYDKYSVFLLSICRRYSKNMEDAKDMCQEVFIKVYLSIDKYSFQGSLAGWLRRLAINFALNTLRTNYYKVKNVDLTETNSLVSHNLAMENFTNEDLLEILNQLTDTERFIFNMIEIDNQPLEYVCQALKLEKSTVRSMNSRLKAKILNLLDEMYKNKN